MSDGLNGLKIENISFNETARWPGFDEIKNLFAFGDSYSAIGFAANLHPPKKVDHKTVPYNGLTYADMDGTNWVGYLLMQHNPHPDLLVHDYAAFHPSKEPQQEHTLPRTLALHVRTGTRVSDIPYKSSPPPILTFSAFDTFTRVLDNPKVHGFSPKNANRAEGAVWRDHLHPTMCSDIGNSSCIRAIINLFPESWCGRLNDTAGEDLANAERDREAALFQSSSSQQPESMPAMTTENPAGPNIRDKSHIMYSFLRSCLDVFSIDVEPFMDAKVSLAKCTREAIPACGFTFTRSTTIAS
ncbi:hypothetical protein C8F04DRAFT_1257615 [Mycena alexandri]|uniref:Uncharacterized protein n=1 Tax=Mycena alexandri TaxID=1745969 RepID=A0AAD6SZU9_9AGAR|nr:hypothetical protein C8F04DRAFT_1257615 [Mycena alexandri]